MNITDLQLNNNLFDNKNRIRIAVSLFYFCQGLAFASWASRIPTIKSKLSLTEGELGTVLLMLPLGQLMTMALSGKLVSKFGSAKVLRIASLFYASILCIIGLTSNVWELGLALLFFGVSGNMCNIAVNTQGVAAEKIFKKSIMSSFHGAWSIAGFTGAIIGLLTMNLHIDTVTHFVIILLVFIINTFINYQYLIPGTDTSTEKKSFFSKPEKALVQLGIIGFFSMATEGAMFDWSGVYFSDIVKAPDNLVIVGYAAFMVMMAIGRFIGDYIISKLGRQKTLQISGLLMFVGMMMSVIFPSFYICTFAFMLVGLGVACNVPTVYSLAGQNTKASPGVALAMVSSISFLGFLMGPPLIGYVAEISNLKYSYGLFAMFGLLMFIMAGIMPVFKVQKK